MACTPDRLNRHGHTGAADSKRLTGESSGAIIGMRHNHDRQGSRQRRAYRPYGEIVAFPDRDSGEMKLEVCQASGWPRRHYL